MAVIALGYLVLNGPIEEWRTFGTDILGLQVGAEPDATPAELWLRMDERSYRLVIQDGPPGLGALGFETATGGELDRVGKSLAEAGLFVEESPALAARRHVRRLLTCEDPTGNQLEIFYGAEYSTAEFVSPNGVKFVTEGMGLGHVVMPVSDREKVVELYSSALGFRISDTISFGVHEAIFMHCNPRHHTVAFFGNIDRGPGIQHFMVEMDSLGAVGRSLDAAVAAGIDGITTIGEHSNDRMVSYYCVTPSGNEIEIGWNGRLVDDDDWLIRQYTSATLWGHKRDEFMFAKDV
jgi:2,3-dihydroxybiphenyl 1,2-dioxygenase